MAENARDNSLLDKVRVDLGLSEEWKQIRQDISVAVRKTLERQRQTQLSPEEYNSLIKKATRPLRKSEAYQKLQTKVASVIELHYPKGSRKTKVDVLETSVYLLKTRPQLTSQLKVFINCPFPQKLRQSAWNAFLQNELIKKEFKLMYEGKEPQDFCNKDPELAETCDRILHSRRFPELNKFINMSFEFYAVLRFWKTKVKQELVNSDFLICLPFLYLFKEELSSKTTNWSIVGTVAEMYVSFMEIMPLNMRSILHEPEHQALTELCQQVESILTEVDSKFVKQLNKILNITERKDDKGSEDTNEPFYQQISGIIHPFLQRMFVGLFSLDVVSFIIDQCLLVLEIPNCSFMPYLVAAWLHLLKRRLCNCHSIESVIETLKKYSENLTITDFQKGTITSKTLTHQISVDTAVNVEYSTETIPEFGQYHTLTKSSKRRSAGSNDSNRTELQTAITRTDVHKKGVEDRTKSTVPNQQVFNLEIIEEIKEGQKRLERELSLMKTMHIEDKKASESFFNNEKQKHHEEALRLRKELEYMKKIVAQRNEIIDTMKQQQTLLINKIAQQDTREETTKEIIEHPQHTIPVRPVTQHKSSSSRLPNTLPSIQSTTVNRVTTNTTDTIKKYNSNNLTESDVQEIWLSIFSKFNEAMYLICHGTDEDKDNLIRSISE